MSEQMLQKAEKEHIGPIPNHTNIPTPIKTDFEKRSGLSFDDVRVHFNSDKPAKIGALAYTQGNQVYIGPGQERHLRHELGHVYQQKTQTILPTAIIKGVPVNKDPKYERQCEQSLHANYNLRLSKRNITKAVSGANQTVQLYTDEELNTLRRLLGYKKWAYDEELCIRLLQAVDRGEKPRIPHHKAVLIKKSDGKLCILKNKRLTTGGGTMGRLAPQGTGVSFEVKNYVEEDGSEAILTEYTHGAIITKESLSKIQKRGNLKQITGDSASSITGIINAEFLHAIAHCLGGADSPENLYAGSHALNTAMIPIEKFVHNLVMQGIPVYYEVTMLPSVYEQSIFISEAIISIGYNVDGYNYFKTCRLQRSNNADASHFLNRESWMKITDIVENEWSQR